MIDKLTSICKFTLCYPVFPDTNSRQKKCLLSDTKPSHKKRYKSLCCCKTLKGGLNIGNVENSFALFQEKKTKKCPFWQYVLIFWIIVSGFQTIPWLHKWNTLPYWAKWCKYTLLFLENKVYCVWVVPAHRTTLMK